MIPDIIERYLIEIILLGGFFLAGPLARIIADSVIEGTERKEIKALPTSARYSECCLPV